MDRRIAAVIGGVGAIALVGAWIALRGDSDRVGASEEHAVIDELTGSYRGIALEDRRAKLVAQFGSGPPLAGQAIEPFETGELPSAPIAGCSQPPDRSRFAALRYDLVVFMLDDRLVCGWLTGEEGAATAQGVAIGDPLSEADEAYPELRCGEVEVGEGTVIFSPDEVSYCQGKLEAHRFIWFGGDPIDVIEMNTETLGRGV